MGFHKDVGFKTNTSQIRGSSVMILTLSHPMLFQFMTVTENLDSKKKKTASYVSDPRLDVILDEQDILIIDPTDDERYVHGVSFNRIPKEERGCRFAFVFRWLSTADHYYSDSDGQYKIVIKRGRGRPKKSDTVLGKKMEDITDFAKLAGTEAPLPSTEKAAKKQKQSKLQRESPPLEQIEFNSTCEKKKDHMENFTMQWADKIITDAQSDVMSLELGSITSLSSINVNVFDNKNEEEEEEDGKPHAV